MSVDRLSLALHLTRQDMSERYAGSVMGPLWALLLPMVQVVLFMVVFGTLIGGRMPGQTSTLDYGIYLVSGLLPWTAFTATLSRMTTVFLDRKPILSKIGLPLPLVAAPIALSEALTLCVGMALLTAIAAWAGRLSPALAVVPLVLLLQQALAFALGTILAALTVFLRDIRELLGIGLQLWFWATPIVYIPEILPGWARPLAVYNPAQLFIRPFHRAFTQGSIDGHTILALAASALAAGALAWWLVNRLERDIRDSI